MVHKVAIVDDDEDLLRLLTTIFRAQGYEVLGCATGEEAIRVLIDQKQGEALALLILDRLLPDMDGLDVLRRLKKVYPGKTPVLILSVLSAEKDVVEGLERGAVDYVAKPFSVNVLLQKARQLIGKK